MQNFVVVKKHTTMSRFNFISTVIFSNSMLPFSLYFISAITFLFVGLLMKGVSNFSLTTGIFSDNKPKVMSSAVILHVFLPPVSLPSIAPPGSKCWARARSGSRSTRAAGSRTRRRGRRWRPGTGTRRSPRSSAAGWREEEGQ